VIEVVLGIVPDVIDVSALPVCLRSSIKAFVALYLAYTSPVSIKSTLAKSSVE
jgi:hypothetical protein